VLFSVGCATRYEYRGELSTAASLIDRTGDPTTEKLTLLAPPTNLADYASNRPAIPVGTSTLSAPSFVPPVTPFPYMLVNRHPTNNGYEWDVKKDASGIYLNSGKLRISKQGDVLIMDAPNQQVENYVIKVLGLKPTQ